MGETITLIAEDGHRLSAYRAAPKGTPRGGLVVIQE
ncbi:MAG TPA: dienelactone hydrolase family protein, partial [Candidatus Limnocylindria bacterium]|nr:dienelactone hydrolase family protein [Candidatus Limnocylindria bacterium]